MHRFYVPLAANADDIVELPEREAHHAASVLRIRPGERAAVLDGRGLVLEGEALAVTKRAVSLQVLKRHHTRRPRWSVTLFPAVAKTKSMDWIIQKATELGVARIAPVQCAHCVSHSNEDAAEAKVEKWRAIAVESIKQCGSPWLPEIDPPRNLPACLRELAPSHLSLVASLAPGAASVRETFGNYVNSSDAPTRDVSIWIGPEGDFSAEELSALLTAGVRPITLGPLVLRCETAVVCAVALVNAELQNLSAQSS